MKITVVKGQSVIIPGQEIDVEIEGVKTTGILQKGYFFAEKEITQIGYISENTYQVGMDEYTPSKYYEFAGKKMKCVVKDNKVIPILRKAKGRERGIFKKLVKDVWKETEYKGPDCEFWPEME